MSQSKAFHIFSTHHYVLPLPEGHRFPMQKYALLHARVEAAELGTMCIPPAANDLQLQRAHTLDYIQRMEQGHMTEREMRRIGFPWSPHMVERSRRSSGATIAACQAGLEYGIAVNLAGGTHHAYADHGEGYCVFNDSVVAARAMQSEGLVRRVVVLDCDVHQGNGTAAICAGDESIFTFSIHGAKNFPFHKEQSDLDIALPDGTSDTEYLVALEQGLSEAIERSHAELAIYLAGADPYEGDKLGRLKMTKAGLHQRDRMVLEYCRAAGLPIAITMAGGYAPDPEDIADIHYATVALAADFVYT